MARTFGPFIKNGNDIFESESGLRWFIIVMAVLMSIGVLIFVIFGIQNYPVKHTYVENPGDPGKLESDRYGFNWILLALSVGAQVLALLFLMSMVIWRANYGCNLIWILLYVLMFVLLIVIIALMGAQYGDCNEPNSHDNMCNDLQWCCVHFINPANMCPNTLPCPGVSQSTLRPNPAFLWVFWTNVAIACLHLVFSVVIVVYWARPAPTSWVQEPDSLPVQSRPKGNPMFHNDNNARRRK